MFLTTPWATHRASHSHISVTKMLVHKGFQEQRYLANCPHLPAGGLGGTQEHFKGFQKPCSQEAGSSSWKHFPDSLAEKPLSEECLGMPPGPAPHWGALGHPPPAPPLCTQSRGHAQAPTARRNGLGNSSTSSLGTWPHSCSRNTEFYSFG